MSLPMSAPQVLDREFLEMRAKLLELAACLDRLDRAQGDVRQDSRLQAIHHALDVLGGEQPHRAERIQRIFSRPYSEGWQATLQLPAGRSAS